MIFNNAVYDSLEAIPSAYPTTSPRDEFELINGKWQLKADAIPGAAQALNPGLYANEQRAITQAKNRQDRINALESELSEAKNELSAVKAPGTVVLSQEDAKAWQKFQSIVSKAGSLKDIEKTVEEYPKVIAKQKALERAEKIKSLASSLNLNGDVLADWANSTAEGELEFLVKEVDVLDQKTGKQVKVNEGFVKVSRQVGDKVEVTEVPLVDHAKAALPEWKFNALTAVKSEDGKAAGAGAGASNGSTRQPVIGGVMLPAGGGSAKAQGEGGGEKLSKRFQAERDAVPNPFKPAAAK